MDTWQPEERHLVILRALTDDDWHPLADIRDPRDPRLVSLRSVLGRLVKLRDEGYVEYRHVGAGEWALTDKGREHV